MSALLTADEAARLRVGVNVIVRPGDREPKTHLHGIKTWDRRVAPQDWVALTGPCPTCKGHRFIERWIDEDHFTEPPCPDCRDGRRIEPLYTECRSDRFKPRMRWCPACNDQHGNPTGRVLVGRGSIEVVPVISEDRWNEDNPPLPCVVVGWNGQCYYRPLRIRQAAQNLGALDPKPIAGQWWGIVIDCVEVVGAH